MATSRLDILLNAKNNASGEIRQVTGDLGDLDNAAGSLTGGIGALAKAVGAVGLLALGQQAASAAIELSQAGFAISTLRDSFDNLAANVGQNSSEMLAALRAASRGTISDLALIESANKALLLGVADTTEEMTALLEVAAARGKALGLSTEQAFNDIVTGIGRVSPLILDNLGITVDLAKANENYARSIGTTVDALTDAEQKQALVNAIMEQSQGITQAAVNPHEQLSAAFTNLRGAVGEFINTATPLPDLLSTIADGVQNLSEQINNLAPPDIELAEDLALTDQQIIALENDVAQLANGLRRLKDAGQENTEEFRAAEEEFRRVSAALIEARLSMSALTGETDSVITGTDGVTQSTQLATIAMAGFGDEVDTTAGKLANYTIEALAAAQAFDTALSTARRVTSALQQDASKLVNTLGPEGALKWYDAQNDALSTQIQQWRDLNYDENEIANVLLPAYLSNLDKGISKLTETKTATESVSEATRELERAYNNVVSKVQGVLQGALNVDVGVSPDDFLPREDAINENARRLADIMVNGIAGQDWLEEFKREVPDLFEALVSSGDPQTAAAKMLREFEQGLRPELIDKEAAKERVRQMLLGDQNLAELAQEIATELAAEMPQFSGAGISSLVNQALGLKGDDMASGLAAGESYAAGAVGAVAQEAPGTAMVRALNEQLAAESNLALINQSGAQAGNVWGVGFLTTVEAGVPSALIQILATLITPAVQAGLRVESELTGAAQ